MVSNAVFYGTSLLFGLALVVLANDVNDSRDKARLANNAAWVCCCAEHANAVAVPTQDGQVVCKSHRFVTICRAVK